MAYGLKYYFVDKKLVGSTTSEYKFEILEDGYSGSSTEWTGVEITRNYDQISYRNINPFQKSSCTGKIRVEDATQRGVIETIAGSEQGDYKVQLKRNNVLIWTGLVLPELTVIGEQNYGNQTANIVAKDIFLSGDFPLATVASGDTEKAIVIIADILDTLGYGLNIVTFTSWMDSTLTQSDDILNQAYHELERFRVYTTNATEEPRALSNEQALRYILTAYGLILRQVDGEWQLTQITAYENLSSVGSWAYTSAGVQYAGSRGQTITPEAPGSDLFVLGGTSNNYFAGVKTVKSKFQHESTIQGIKFNPEYWIDDGATVTEEQFWQADGTGNLELSFVHWFAKTTDTDLGNTNTLNVRIFIDTGGALDWYWDGSSWTSTPTDIQYNVEETYSTTDSNGDYVYKGEPFSIVTDPIPDYADGTLTVEFDPDEAQPNYSYFYLRDVRFHLTYNDNVVGTSFAIDFELTQSGTYSDFYDVGTYHFGEGPTSASLSAIKDSTGDLLASWKRYGDVSTITHQQLLLNEILHVRRSPKRNMRATLYGEFEPDTILLYDSTNFFFLGGSWNSKSYQWSASFTDITYSEASDTLNAFYLTDGSATSSGAVGSSGGSSTSSPTNALLRANNLSDVNSASTSRDNLDLGTSDTVQFNELGLGTSPSFATGSGLEIDKAGIATVRLQNSSTGKTTEITQGTNFEIDTLNSGMDIVLDATTDTIFQILDSEIARVSSSGIGINTINPPGQFLEIKETSNGAGDAVIRLRGHGNNADNTILGALEWWNADSSGDQPGVVARVEAVSGNSNGHMGELVFKTHDGSEGGEGSDPVERLRIDAVGNVIVKHDIQSDGSATFGDGTTSEDVRVYYSDGSYTEMAGFGFNYNRTTSYHRPNVDVSQELIIGTDVRQWNSIKFDSTEYRFFDDGTLVFFIDNTGDVGIGNPTNNARLHVKKATADLLRLERADGTGTTDIDLVFSGGNFGADDADEQYAKITCARGTTLSGIETADLEFYIKDGGTDTKVLTLKNDQNILIGTDGVPNGTSIYGSAFIDDTDDANVLRMASSASGPKTLIQFFNPNGTVGSIATNASATAYNTSSDYRLKENVVEMTGALDRVDQLKPSRFNFKADPNTTVDGFLAHEVENIIPEAITGEKDAVDDEGSPIYQGIDQSKIVPLLVGAIKELRAEIEELKAQLS